MAGHKSKKKGSNIICRVSNATPEMVCRYVQRLPKRKMTEKAFRDFMGPKWFQNEHQAPEQWGLYYLDGDFYYPRFNRDITLEEAKRYLYGWIKRLIVINPYTRFKASNDKRLVESIVEQLEIDPTERDLKTIIRKIINTDEPFIVNDIIVNALNSYSEVLAIETIDKENELFTVSLLPNYKEILKTKYNMTKKEYFDSFNDINTNVPLKEPHQIIYYGAPGTGKSFKTNEVVAKYSETIRITFHPDSDYSTFVGAYKPAMEDVGIQVVPVVVNNGISLEQNKGTYTENRITYKFVKQAFLKAYIKAWSSFAQFQINTPATKSGIILNSDTNPEDRWLLRQMDNQTVDYTKISTIKTDVFKDLVKKCWTSILNSDDPNVYKIGTTQGYQASVCFWYRDKETDFLNHTADQCWASVFSELSNGNEIVYKPGGTQNYYISLDGDNIVAKSSANSWRDTIETLYNNFGPNPAGNIRYAIAKKLKSYETNFDEAWNKLKEEIENNPDQVVGPFIPDDVTPQFLVIEEINRGNCAQIFGDLFQLLDRKNGFSEYPIDADEDIRKALLEKNPEDGLSFGEDGLHLPPVLIDYIDQQYQSCQNVAEKLSQGQVLVLPPNLYIWATMNTSDQSLFPIDSAFKRRWDWKYIPIKDYEDKAYIIIIDSNKYKWWGFLEKINRVIGNVTSAEDKKMGYFFVKPDDKEITTEQFIDKVLFYLWNDVFKNYGFDDPIFSKGDKEHFTFSDFFLVDGTPNTENVNRFLRKLDETIDKEHPFEIKNEPEETPEDESIDNEENQSETPETEA